MYLLYFSQAKNVKNNTKGKEWVEKERGEE